MTEKQFEALRLYNALALSDKLRLDLMLQPGDLQLLSNHTQVHTRSAYVDHPVSTHFPVTQPCSGKTEFDTSWLGIHVPQLGGIPQGRSSRWAAAMH